MFLPVWPSALIRLAVIMCSASSTLRGRPNNAAAKTVGASANVGPATSTAVS